MPSMEFGGGGGGLSTDMDGMMRKMMEDMRVGQRQDGGSIMRTG